MNLIKKIEVFIGSIDNVNVHPRDVFREAIKLNATYIIVMHNHPSGDTHPSKEDVIMTERLVQTGELIGIKVVDHIIISCESYYSFYDIMNKNE